MFQKFSTVVPIVVWCIFFLDRSDAQSTVNVPLPSSLAVSLGTSPAVSLGTTPALPLGDAVSSLGDAAKSLGKGALGTLAPDATQDPAVQELAQSISNGLQNSQVLGSSAKFCVRRPFGILFRVGSLLLLRAGMVNPVLATLDATAGKGAGPVSSKLYFDTFGNEFAKFLGSKGLVNSGNVKFWSMTTVGAIELEFCRKGKHGTEPAMNAVVLGLFNVLDSIGMTNVLDITNLFTLFGKEIATLKLSDPNSYAC